MGNHESCGIKSPQDNNMQDSDSLYVTNQSDIVEHAKMCMIKYPTTVNNIPVDKNHYKNTPADYAAVDNGLAHSQRNIGESSNLAQVALSYESHFKDKKYTDCTYVLAVLAQLGRFGGNAVQKIFGEFLESYA